MPLFNLFSARGGSAAGGKKKEKVQAPKEEVKKEVAPKELLKDSSGIILRSHVSEKASQFQQNNKYVFEVFSAATKLMIRDAVERTYGVSASKVRIINVKPRKVRVGKFQGKSPGFKKAIVKLKIGQKIDSLSA